MRTKKTAAWSFTPALVVFFGIASLLFFMISIKYIINQKHETKIAELEETILQTKAAVTTDAVRQFNIQKIISIIDQYNTVMPRAKKYEIAEEIYNMSLKYPNLSVDLLCAAITHESAGTWDPAIKSPAGAIGLMQIMPATGMFIAAQEGIPWTSAAEILTDPIYNIRIGARYLSSLIELYDVDGGLAAYNSGEMRAALWMKSGKKAGILPKETQHYIPSVQRLYKEYASFTM